MTIFINQGKIYKENSQVYSNTKGFTSQSYANTSLDYREELESILDGNNLCPECAVASGVSYPEVCSPEDTPSITPIEDLVMFTPVTTTTTTTSTSSEPTTSTTTTTTSGSPSTTSTAAP